ncbi:MAG TPA: hypothetical protein VLC93_07970, partial [Myxococcota bacterium]|nr:hypothetical protein [Myxococcota bacterium]
LGYIDGAAVAQAVVAAGPPDAMDRYRALGNAGLDFGYVDNAAIVRAILATGPEGSVERYRELSRDRGAFGYVDQNAVTRAWLATGRVLPYLPAVPAADDE